MLLSSLLIALLHPPGHQKKRNVGSAVYVIGQANGLQLRCIRTIDGGFVIIMTCEGATFIVS